MQIKLGVNIDHIATLRQARRILVIHEGRLVEDGTHEELMQKQGYYFRLYQLQFNNHVRQATGDEKRPV